jgi:1-acyl-sn-glycerol-3-phosphate acyltransferase
VKASLDKKDISWSIFAEGTRNRDVNAPMKDFRGGTFKIAYDTKTTILPVALYGTHYPLSMKYQWKWFPIQVRVYPPIPYEQYKDRNTNEIAREIQDMMQQGVDQLRATDVELTKNVHKRLKKKD